MPSKGSPKIVFRVEQELYERILETVERNNLTKRDEPWTMTSWILDCVREKLRHQSAANVQREKRKVERAAARRRECLLREATSQASSDVEIFELTWDCLAHGGLCDARGSKEYARVLGLWFCSKPPGDLIEWIRAQVSGSPANA